MEQAIAVRPALNAAVHGLSATMLTAGHLFIRYRNITARRWFTHSAFSVSARFLISYLTYVSCGGNTPFAGQGWSRPVSSAILFSHIALAIAIVPWSRSRCVAA